MASTIHNLLQCQADTAISYNFSDNNKKLLSYLFKMMIYLQWAFEKHSDTVLPKGGKSKKGKDEEKR
jgi:hypothetical protein